MLDDKIKAKLIDIVGSDGVKDGEAVNTYAVDGVLPNAVVFPKTSAEVEQIVVTALNEGLAVVPWGGGTEIALGAVPGKVDVVMAMAGLDRIEDLDHENMTLTVEAGMPLDTLQEKLRQVNGGFFFPLDPPCADEATIGGVVATNASGPRRLAFGTLRDMVLGVHTVIPEEMDRGCKICAGGKTAKNVSGYDMSKLYIGSLGTLAVVVSVTCKILPLPEDRATLVGAFTDAAGSWKCAYMLADSRLSPACIEIYNAGTASLLPVNGAKAAQYVVVGAEGVKEAVGRQVTDIEKIFRDQGAKDVAIVRGDDEGAFWKEFGKVGKKVREDNVHSIGLKISVPIAMSDTMSRAVVDEAAELSIPVCQYAHAGNGIVYSYLALDIDTFGNVREKLTTAVSTLRQQAKGMGGSLVIEYAPSAFKERIDVWGDPGGALKVMERVKKEFDPKNILNPGRFVGGI